MSIAGTEWDKIGILSDLFDSNNNRNNASENNDTIPIDESIGMISADISIDTNALINNDLDEDKGDHKNTIISEKVTIGLARCCLRTITIKKLPLLINTKVIVTAMLQNY